MSLLKKLFGGGAKTPTAPRIAAQESYEGYDIAAAPVAEGGQYRLAGTITRTAGGETKVHRLVRADLFSTEEDAARFTIDKAKRLIDEQGEALFRD